MQRIKIPYNFETITVCLNDSLLGSLKKACNFIFHKNCNLSVWCVKNGISTSPLKVFDFVGFCQAVVITLMHFVYIVKT